jgi:hypothetical protein
MSGAMGGRERVTGDSDSDRDTAREGLDDKCEHKTRSG